MAILKNAYLAIGGTDYSSTVQSLDVPLAVEQVDDTAMGDDTRSNAGSLKTWEISGVVHWGAGGSGIDDELAALMAASSAGTATLEVRPDAGAVSTSNPKWSGTGLLTEYGLIGQSVGDQHTSSFKFVATTDLTRATA